MTRFTVLMLARAWAFYVGQNISQNTCIQIDVTDFSDVEVFILSEVPQFYGFNKLKTWYGLCINGILEYTQDYCEHKSKLRLELFEDEESYSLALYKDQQLYGEDCFIIWKNNIVTNIGCAKTRCPLSIATPSNSGEML